MLGEIVRTCPQEPTLRLGEYLQDLSAHAELLRDRPELTMRRFVELIEAPLLGPLRPDWADKVPSGRAIDYAIWNTRLRELIADFDALDQSGKLNKDNMTPYQDYVVGPSGLQWWNLDVHGFLSAAHGASFFTRRVRTRTLSWEQCEMFLWLGVRYE